MIDLEIKGHKVTTEIGIPGSIIETRIEGSGTEIDKDKGKETDKGTDKDMIEETEMTGSIRTVRDQFISQTSMLQRSIKTTTCHIIRLPIILIYIIRIKYKLHHSHSVHTHRHKTIGLQIIHKDISSIGIENETDTDIRIIIWVYLCILILRTVTMVTMEGK